MLDGQNIKGEITRVNSDGTYDIKFDDGERKMGVKESEIEGSLGQASDATVGITFKSSLVWVEGSRDLLNPHPENPHYLKGDLRRFFEETNFDERFSNRNFLYHLILLIFHLLLRLL